MTNCKKVYIAASQEYDYQKRYQYVCPELEMSYEPTLALKLVRELFQAMGLDGGNYGTEQWNPLKEIISPGDSVVIKPNWVTDKNHLLSEGWECLITHPTLIEAVLYYVIKANPQKVMICDAPIQSCDLPQLLSQCKLNEIVSRFSSSGCDISILDWRMTRMSKGKYSIAETKCRDQEQYYLFDLKDDSWLTPITEDNTEFRVTCYDPDVLKKHHHPGKHEYLIAKEVIDADVVISMPKLKTHQKAGITGALKNMVGINGYKEYLPHHRKGGSGRGGDCYRGKSKTKYLAEFFLDTANRSSNSTCRYFYFFIVKVLVRSAALFFKETLNTGGSWFGNDTVWRMCLDLQRILWYGCPDGFLADVPQRKIITITDGIIAGQGNGPLSPKPINMGILTLGENVAALEYVHSLLMLLDLQKIPLVRHAFDKAKWPLADFEPSDTQIICNGKEVSREELFDNHSQRFELPKNWESQIEL